MEKTMKTQKVLKVTDGRLRRNRESRNGGRSEVTPGRRPGTRYWERDPRKGYNQILGYPDGHSEQLRNGYRDMVKYHEAMAKVTVSGVRVNGAARGIYDL